MIVSHKHEFIFMKSYKTASSSMEIALSQALGPDDILTPAREGLDGLRKTPGGQNYRFDHPDVPRVPLWRKLLRRPERHYHPTVGFFDHMPAWRARRYLGEKIWSRYYKFAFERNPWDRHVSFYHYKMRDKARDKMRSFDDFLVKARNYKVNNWEIYAIGDSVAMDFVGRYEEVAEGFEQALGEIGLAGGVALPKANVGKGKPKNKSYRDYYSDETRDLIAKVCAREIAYFGYEF